VFHVAVFFGFHPVFATADINAGWPKVGTRLTMVVGAKQKKKGKPWRV